MGIEIVSQTNEQECGVCVLTSLHNHYYPKQLVEKEKVLEESQIKNGMTLFDFESLGLKLELECESYDVNYSEFLGLKINNYFVLLLATANGGNHYVIAKKKKNYLEIYDSSDSKPQQLSFEDLKKIFLNVIILVNKKPNQTFTKVFGNTRSLLLIDLKFVLLNLLLSLLILGTSIGAATFLNFVIDLAISKSSITNLITICFIYVLIYFSNDLLTYISGLYMSKHIKNYLVLFTNKMLSCLQNKKADFLFKVDKHWIYKVDECAYSCANFCVVEINKFITNIIFVIICICIIGSLQYWLLIFAFLYIIIEFIFFLFAYQKKKDLFIKVVRSENKNTNYYKQLINNLTQQMWLSKRQSLLKRIKNNYSEIYKNYHDAALFRSNSALCKSLLKSFIEIALIAVAAVLMIKQNALSLGQLTFVIVTFGLLKNSSSELFSYFLSKLEFDIYWQVYKDITTVSNLPYSNQINFEEEIKTIGFEINNQIIKLSKQFTRLESSIHEIIANSNKILINDKEINKSKQLFDSIIIYDQNTNIDIDLLLSQIESNPQFYIQYLKYFNIDLNKQSFSFYEKLIINLLTLCSETNKIIFIDDVYCLFKKKDSTVIKQLLNNIRKDNFVFITGKEEND